MMRFVSLGAGVQSTTVLLMAVAGELGPLPDAAIFADTGWEPAAVYRHLEWLEAEVGARVPIHRVTAGDLRENMLRSTRGERRTAVGYAPLFVRQESEIAPDRGGTLWRQCTRDYKLRPIRRKTRALMDAVGATHCEQWIGISLDEAHRMKDSGVGYITNVYPLVDRRMTRHDCLLWLQRQGYPTPPKSACIGCPYHSNATWRRLRDEDAAGWADAVEFDRLLRSSGKLPGVTGDAYLHRTFIPLDQVDLSTAADHGQLELFGNECEGMCGV